MEFELPEDIAKETGTVFDLEAKTKILGLNAARLYGIDIEAQKKLLAPERAAAAKLRKSTPEGGITLQQVAEAT